MTMIILCGIYFISMTIVLLLASKEAYFMKVLAFFVALIGIAAEVFLFIAYFS